MSGTKARRVVSVSGNPRPASRTAGAAAALGGDLHAALGFPVGEAVHLDLAEAPSPLGPGALAALAEALDAVTGSAVVVVATPTYKASYTGLLKAFVDLLPPGALVGSVAVPVLTLGSAAHTLAGDVHLRPLLLELGASVPTPTVALLETDLADIAGTSARRAEALAAAIRAPALEGAGA